MFIKNTLFGRIFDLFHELRYQYYRRFVVQLPESDAMLDTAEGRSHFPSNRQKLFARNLLNIVELAGPKELRVLVTNKDVQEMLLPLLHIEALNRKLTRFGLPPERHGPYLEIGSVFGGATHIRIFYADEIRTTMAVNALKPDFYFDPYLDDVPAVVDLRDPL